MDIKILDDEIRSIGTEIKNNGQKLEDIFNRYVTCMNKLGKEGIKGGTTSDNILAYVGTVRRLNDAVTNCTQQVCDRCFSYIEEIDRADDFLF